MRFFVPSTLFVAVGIGIFVSASNALEPEPAQPTPEARGIVANQPSEGPYVKIDGGYMVPYTETIPGS